MFDLHEAKQTEWKEAQTAQAETKEELSQEYKHWAGYFQREAHKSGMSFKQACEVSFKNLYNFFFLAVSSICVYFPNLL